MRSLQRIALAAAAAALAIGVGTLLGFVDPNAEAVLEFSVVTLAAVLVSAFAIPRSGISAGAPMPASFVLTFAAMLRFRGAAAVVVAAAGAATAGFVQWRLAHPLRRVGANTSIVIATFAAALVYHVLGGPAAVDWLWHAVSIAVALLVYCVVATAVTELL